MWYLVNLVNPSNPSYNLLWDQPIDIFKRIPFDYCKTASRIKYEEIKVVNMDQEDGTILTYPIEPSAKRDVYKKLVIQNYQV